MISERTRAALGIWKGQAAQLGNRTNLAAAQATGSARTAAAAFRFPENTAPLIHQVRASGVTSLRGIADVLNTRGVHRTYAATQASNARPTAAMAAFRSSKEAFVPVR